MALQLGPRRQQIACGGCSVPWPRVILRGIDLDQPEVDPPDNEWDDESLEDWNDDDWETAEEKEAAEDEVHFHPHARTAMEDEDITPAEVDQALGWDGHEQPLGRDRFLLRNRELPGGIGWVCLIIKHKPYGILVMTVWRRKRRHERRRDRCVDGH